jgi:hypothetical protein
VKNAMTHSWGIKILMGDLEFSVPMEMFLDLTFKEYKKTTNKKIHENAISI